MCDELNIHDKHVRHNMLPGLCLCYLLKASQFSYISKTMLIVYVMNNLTQITKN